jgi:hypothetical protein
LYPLIFSNIEKRLKVPKTAKKIVINHPLKTDDKREPAAEDSFHAAGSFLPSTLVDGLIISK